LPLVERVLGFVNHVGGSSQVVVSDSNTV
jgi:hypothetical protein